MATPMALSVTGDYQ